MRGEGEEKGGLAGEVPRAESNAVKIEGQKRSVVRVL